MTLDERGLTPKQEAFCLAFVETANASEAYRRAYDAGAMKAASVHTEASRLIANPRVAGRIGELRAELKARQAVSLDSLTAQLVMDRALAHRSGSAGAAVSATLAMARLHGIGPAERPEAEGGGAPVALTVNWVRPEAEAEGAGPHPVPPPRTGGGNADTPRPLSPPPFDGGRPGGGCPPARWEDDDDQG